MDCESQLPPPARNNTRTIVGGLVAATLAVALVVALSSGSNAPQTNDAAISALATTTTTTALGFAASGCNGGSPCGPAYFKLRGSCYQFDLSLKNCLPYVKKGGAPGISAGTCASDGYTMASGSEEAEVRKLGLVCGATTTLSKFTKPAAATELRQFCKALGKHCNSADECLHHHNCKKVNRHGNPFLCCKHKCVLSRTHKCA